jgi:hypothetical protein
VRHIYDSSSILPYWWVFLLPWTLAWYCWMLETERLITVNGSTVENHLLIICIKIQSACHERALKISCAVLCNWIKNSDFENSEHRPVFWQSKLNRSACNYYSEWRDNHQKQHHFLSSVTFNLHHLNFYVADVNLSNMSVANISVCQHHHNSVMRNKCENIRLWF